MLGVPLSESPINIYEYFNGQLEVSQITSHPEMAKYAYWLKHEKDKEQGVEHWYDVSDTAIREYNEQHDIFPFVPMVSSAHEHIERTKEGKIFGDIASLIKWGLILGGVVSLVGFIAYKKVT